jgi:hypothetical protein
MRIQQQPYHTWLIIHRPLETKRLQLQPDFSRLQQKAPRNETARTKKKQNFGKNCILLRRQVLSNHLARFKIYFFYISCVNNGLKMYLLLETI